MVKLPHGARAGARVSTRSGSGSTPAGSRGPRRSSARTTARPGIERRTAGPGPTRATAESAARLSRRGPRGLTSRAIMLGLVVCALVLSLAYPIKEYVGQRGHIAALEQQAREQTAQVAALEERQKQLADPAYIEQQARTRLKYVLPGDKVYIVVDRNGTARTDPKSSTDAAQSGGTPAAPAQPDLPAAGGSWLERLGESVRGADAGG